MDLKSIGLLQFQMNEIRAVIIIQFVVLCFRPAGSESDFRYDFDHPFILTTILRNNFTAAAITEESTALPMLRFLPMFGFLVVMFTILRKVLEKKF